MNNIYFQINNGKKRLFTSVRDGEQFTLVVSKFPTREFLDEERITSYYAIQLTDDDGNTFKLIPLNEPDGKAEVIVGA